MKSAAYRAYRDRLVAGEPPACIDDLEKPCVRLLRALRHFDEVRFRDLAFYLAISEDQTTHEAWTYRRTLARLVESGDVEMRLAHGRIAMFRLPRKKAR